MKTAKIILWDVYGTLLAAQRGDLDSLLQRKTELRAAFEATAREFNLPARAAELHEGFLAGIQAEQNRRRTAGVAHPEIRIEEIWRALVPGATLERARAIAFFFEQRANPKQLMPEAFATLVALRQRGHRQGIISNAQFYTARELAALLCAESDCSDCRYETLFDPALIFYSCDLGVAKPDLTAFRLARAKTQPAECLFVGDSPTNDIAPARQVGFTGLLYGPTGAIQRLSQVLEYA